MNTCHLFTADRLNLLYFSTPPTVTHILSFHSEFTGDCRTAAKYLWLCVCVCSQAPECETFECCAPWRMDEQTWSLLMGALDEWTVTRFPADEHSTRQKGNGFPQSKNGSFCWPDILTWTCSGWVSQSSVLCSRPVSSVWVFSVSTDESTTLRFSVRALKSLWAKLWMFKKQNKCNKPIKSQFIGSAGQSVLPFWTQRVSFTNKHIHCVKPWRQKH